MSHHHNPMDPRDPRNAPFFFMSMESDRGKSPNPVSGCGCLSIALLLALAGLISALH